LHYGQNDRTIPTLPLQADRGAMQFTKRTIVVSRASAVEAEQRVDRYGRLVETRARAGDLQLKRSGYCWS
jgi:hypothetical protein